MDMYSLPFLFKNEAQFGLWRTGGGGARQTTEDKGIKTTPIPTRRAISPRKIRLPDDMKGVKVRVMASPVMISTMKALGAGVPVAWAELYTALDRRRRRRGNNHPSVVAKSSAEVRSYTSTSTCAFRTP
jgi:TRAP-type C4-dicarboxylate transport system substrate-binding protein